MTTICDNLRKAVLQAAIQGKLTKQLPEDGNAEDLFKEIQAEKQWLIKEGKLKKEKSLPVINDEDIPFDIPDNWKWVWLGEIGSLIRGSGIKKAETTRTGKPCVRYGEIYTSFELRFDEAKTCTSDDVFEKCKKIKKGDLIFTLTGENKPDIAKAVAYLGCNDVAVGGDLAIWSNHGCDPLFLAYFMYSDYAINQKVAVATGDIIVHISCDKVGRFLLPLPPLAEQKRIVSRLDELMKKIDEIGETENDITTLYDAFPGDMKASLLQAAIQGKLTKQLPEDGNAEDLYMEIQAEKQILIKEGKLKKEKSLPVINGENIPFDIPDNWKWVRFGSIVNIVSARRVHQSDWKTEGIPFYRAREIGKLAVDGYVDNDLFISKELYSKLSVSGVPLPGDLMVTAVGTLGKTYIVKPGDVFYYKDASVICLENRYAVNSEYLLYIMNSNMLWQQIISNSSGTTVATLTIERMMNYILPLPPLAEQKRIVEKLNQLLPLCDAMNKAIVETAC